MKNHLNILPKLASFDLKCSKMRWRLGLRPRPRWGAYDAPSDPLIVRGNAPSALGTLYFVSIFTSQFPFRAPPPYGIPGSATGPVNPLLINTKTKYSIFLNSHYLNMETKMVTIMLRNYKV